MLGILLHDAGARQTLLIAQLDAAQIQNAILHGRQHLLASPRGVSLIEGGHDAERQMQPRAAVADLRARHERRPVIEAGGRSRSAGALRDVLIHLAFLVGPRTEAFHRRDDHARVELLYPLPGEAHAVEGARCEVLH
jgi:hypothetical protein